MLWPRHCDGSQGNCTDVVLSCPRGGGGFFKRCGFHLCERPPEGEDSTEDQLVLEYKCMKVKQRSADSKPKINSESGGEPKATAAS